VPATFSGVQVSVLDLSVTGLRLEHASPMRIASSGAIHLETEENDAHVTVKGRVVWSRLSCVADASGKLLYQSGVRLDEVSDSVAGLFGRVIHLYGERDSQSILTKRAVRAARASGRVSGTTPTSEMSTPGPSVTITADDAVMIRQAAQALKNQPDKAIQWHNRARYSDASRQLRDTPEGRVPYPTDVIVIWEYLGGKIDLEAIFKVLQQRGEG
jgi:hypothetical protein